MTKDEALKLSLEALETYYSYMEPFLTVFGGPRVPAEQSTIWKVEQAIKAIKQALANEALDRKAENARELGLDYEPEQEPVAYGMWDTMLGYGGRMMMVRLDKGQDGCTVPLYTTPPQRKPLSNEEIMRNDVLRYHFALNGGAGPISKQGRKVIDAIEAAHNIKGEA